MKLVKNDRGFTIIELLIATVVFSVILVVILAAFVQISRLFYKGVNMSNTQDDTRRALNDIASDIQFASSSPPSACTGSGCPNYFCVGNHRYTFFLGAQVGYTSPAGIYREDETGNCPPPTGPTAVKTGSADQLLGNGMQLNSIKISCDGIACHLHAHVIFYGGTPQGLFVSTDNPSSKTPWKEPDADCTGALISSQYCSTADYSSTILEKI